MIVAAARPFPLHIDDKFFVTLLLEYIDRQQGTAASVDAILLLGPLDHLTNSADRLRALQEATRILRPGDRVFSVGISRFTPLFDGLSAGFLDDPAFARIVDRDLRDGQHRNPPPPRMVHHRLFPPPG